MADVTERSSREEQTFHQLINDNETSGPRRVLAWMRRINQVAGVQDPTAMVQGFLDLLMDMAQAEQAYFFQLDPATDELVITHARGDETSQYLIGLRVKRQGEHGGFALCSPNVVVVGDITREPDWLLAIDPIGAARKHNVINLPVTHGETLLGAVQLFNYAQPMMDMLQGLTERMGLEIVRKAEVSGLRRSNQRLTTLVDMIGELAGTLDRNHLLHLVTENAARLVESERSSVFLVDPGTREMIFQVSYQSPEQTAAAPQPQPPAPKAWRAPLGQSGEFSFFNRSAITVPIQSRSAEGDANSPSHILGGLMVLNKQNATFQEEDAQLMSILAGQASTFLQIAEMYESSGELFLGVVKALATAIDAKDPYTQGHSQRVSEFSVMIAQRLGFDEVAQNDLRIGSLLHDVGKIGIPDAILLKKGTLTEMEMEYIKHHPRLGANILNQVKLLEPAVPAIIEHHERLDGSGYPKKLSGSQISWMGRVVAVADVYDAMTSDRPYRLGVRPGECLAFLKANAGRLFDPECVLALESIILEQRSAAEGKAAFRGG